MTVPNAPPPFEPGNSSGPDAYLDDARRAGAECLAVALDYLGRGWSSLPLCPPDHLGMRLAGHDNCKHPGKRPWHKWTKHQTERPTEQEVRSWWRQVPTANVGIALGPVSGLVRLDVDGEQGEQFLAELSGGDVPDTLEMISGGGGRGLLFAIPPGVTLRPTHYHGDKIHEGLSLLGEGAQTVMPPSRHKNGPRYAWRTGHSPDDIDPAPAPAWLVARMSTTRKSRLRATASNGAPPIGERIGEGSRNVTLTSLAGTMRRRGMSQDAILAALLVINEQQCDPPLDENEVETIARSVARYDPAPSSTSSSAAPGSTDPNTLTGVLLAHLRATYEPLHRRDQVIWSKTLGRTVDLREAGQGPGTPLLTRLVAASNWSEAHVLRHWRQYLGVAWADLLATLQEEAATEEVDPCAEDELRRVLAALLGRVVSLGHVVKDEEGEHRTEVQARSLLDWCLLWADVEGNGWRSVRSYWLWCRLSGNEKVPPPLRGGTREQEAAHAQKIDAERRRRLRVAFRVELAGQLGVRPLADWPMRRLTELCEHYGLGGRVRIGHSRDRAIELAPEFLADLLGCPTDREPGEEG
jgi:putative DNA primase/helicase